MWSDCRNEHSTISEPTEGPALAAKTAAGADGTGEGDPDQHADAVGFVAGDEEHHAVSPQGEGADMKALSVRQPYASLLMSGLKQYETRDWPLRRELWGVKLALHASKTYDRFDQACTEELMHWPQLHAVLLGKLPLGEVMGIVIVEAVYRSHEIARKLNDLERAQGNYQPGRAAWKIRVVDVFPKPIPAVGKLGLWEWSP